jgi:hypothetical protein
MVRTIFSMYAVFMMAACSLAPVQSTSPALLSQDYLCSRSFFADHENAPFGAVSIELSFERNSTYSAAISFGDHGPTLTGKYMLAHGALTLYVDNDARTQLKTMADVNLDARRDWLFKKGVLVNDPSSLTYSTFLQFENGIRFYDEKSSPGKEGTAVTIGKLPAVLMGMKPGKANTTVKFRERPDVKSKEIHLDQSPMDPLRAVPAGTELAVLARTSSREKVQKWENYWYYVEIPGRFGNTRGWMFAEFVDLK